jgi:hypothetical protein
MKHKSSPFKAIPLFMLILGSFLACESEFASLDSDVISQGNAVNFLTDVQEYPMITYNKKTGPVQTNGLSSYLLGYYNDPVYGAGVANVLSQMGPPIYDPTFGDNVVIDSVVLTIPYFSTATDTDEDGSPVFELDSVIGSDPIKLSVYKSNYFLRNFDPGSEFNESQKYFSNGSIAPNDLINSSDLEGTLLYQNDSFVPSSEVIILTELDEETGEMVESVRLTPGLRVLLDNPNDSFWQDLIFDKEGEIELSNENNFLNHFRGLYIKSEIVGPEGTMLLLNINAADSNITIYYTSDNVGEPDSGEEADRSQNSFILNFLGNQVAIYNNNFISIPDGDAINGNENLYLKGGGEGTGGAISGGGSMAIVDLFSGQVENEEGVMVDAFEDFLKTYRRTDANGDFILSGGDFVAKRLINEAYLEFFVDQTVGLDREPERLYLYDLENESALVDFVLDQSATESDSKTIFSEPLTRVGDEVDGEGIKYKIRITEHLNNLVLRDSSNVTLGLVVTSNINSVDNLNLQNEDELASSIPSGAILSPLGTVLHGNNSSNTDKRARLQIFFTEPDN